ncbi:MAG: hypothetical protein ACOYB3_01955 [Azonexus sp.]
MKVHYKPAGKRRGACWWADHPTWMLSSDVLDVTCKDCLGTNAYREGMGVALIDARARVIFLEKKAGVR